MPWRRSTSSAPADSPLARCARSTRDGSIHGRNILSARKILLDPAGKALDSKKLTALFDRDLVFVIGGADGLPPEWRARGDLLLSLSALTMPHELARVMLAEQIYRALTTLRGHPYPR